MGTTTGGIWICGSRSARTSARFVSGGPRRRAPRDSRGNRRARRVATRRQLVRGGVHRTTFHRPHCPAARTTGQARVAQRSHALGPRRMSRRPACDASAVAARAARFLPRRPASGRPSRTWARGRQRREHGRHVLRDAALELRGDARGGVLRGRRCPPRATPPGGGRYARRAPAHVLRPILAHPRLERLVEQRALHSVPERHERTVRTHALVLHTRFGGRRAEGNDAHVRVRRGGASEADLLGLELRLRARAWCAGARTACARKRARRRPHPRGGSQARSCRSRKTSLTSRRARSRRDDYPQPRRRRRRRRRKSALPIWRRLPELARAAVGRRGRERRRR